MNELVEWLRAQLDEDESTALSAARAVAEHTYAQIDVHANVEAAKRWTSEPLLFHRVVRAAGPAGWQPKVTDSVWAEVGDHVAAWDPTRVLAEVAAKRAILDGLPPEHWAVRLVALPYADQPGYRDEWRP